MYQDIHSFWCDMGFLLCLRLKKKRKNTNQLRGELNGKWSRSPTQIWTTCTFPRLFRVIYIPCLFIILIYAMASEARKKALYGIKFFCAFHFELHVCHSLDLIHPIHHRQSIDLIHKCISCRGQFFVWLLFPSCNINYPDSLDLQSHCAWYFNGL